MSPQSNSLELECLYIPSMPSKFIEGILKRRIDCKSGGRTGYPLFPGENEVEQLACMMEVLGLPPNSVLENATRKKMFFGVSQTFKSPKAVKCHPHSHSHDISRLYMIQREIERIW